MAELLKKYLLASGAFRMADGEGEPIGIIELEGSLADAEKPPELRAGRYVGEIQGVEIKTSGAGNKYFAVKFVIPPEELPADVKDDYEDGAVLYWNRQLVPDGTDRRTLYNCRKFIEAIGLDTNTNQINPDEWMGQRARLRITQSAYQGEMRAQINAVEAMEGEAKPSSRGQAQRGKTKDEEEERPAPRSRAAAAGRRGR